MFFGSNIIKITVKEMLEEDAQKIINNGNDREQSATQKSPDS